MAWDTINFKRAIIIQVNISVASTNTFTNTNTHTLTCWFIEGDFYLYYGH